MSRASRHWSLTFVAAWLAGCGSTPIQTISTPAARTAEAAPTPAELAIDAPPAAPSQPTTQAAPPWTDSYRAALDAVWSSDAISVLSNPHAAYIERSSGGRLCVWPEGSLRCFAWPAGMQVVSLDYWSQTGGSATVATPGAEHHLTVRVTGDAMVLERNSSQSIPSTLQSQDYTKPPSLRLKVRKAFERALWKHGKPKLAPSASDAASELVGALHGLSRSVAVDFTVHATRHEGSALAIVSELISSSISIEVDRQWTCTRRNSQADCTTTPGYSDVRVVAPERSLPAAWLLQARTGSGRSGSTLLVWLDTASWHAELSVGGIDGYGEHCDDAPGYCVWVEGLWTPFELLSPSCIRIAESVAWSAVYIRMQERWADEKRYAPEPNKAPVPGTYSPTPDGWKVAACEARAESGFQD